MATFASSQDFTVAQSSDCKTLTFTDISNYTSNNEGWTISSFTDRKFLIYDSDGVLVNTVTLGSLLNGTYTLTVDKMLSVTLSCTPPTGPALLKTRSVLSTCFLQLCFAELVAKTDCGCGDGCGCSSSGCDNVESDKVKLLQHIKAAEVFAAYSNPVLTQKQLSAGQLICDANENNS
jgi:hypothetical protein